MMKEILFTHQADKYFTIYGFGSFFRDELYNDIDLLFVFLGDKKELNTASMKMRNLCSLMATCTQKCIDPLLLSIEEFDEEPLRDMDQLKLFHGNFPLAKLTTTK